MSIKSWWKAFWGDDQRVSENGLPPVTETLPMPEVKPCKPEKNISEPVISFIKLYKENPKRFRIYCGGRTYRVNYKIVDKKNNTTFSATNIKYLSNALGISTSEWIAGTNTGWATDDEFNEVFTAVIEERISRYNRLKKQRNDIQRERLTKLYKGE